MTFDTDVKGTKCSKRGHNPVVHHQKIKSKNGKTYIYFRHRCRSCEYMRKKEHDNILTY